MAKDGGLIKAIAIGLGCGLVITGGCYVALNFDKIFNKQEQVIPAPDVPDVPGTPDEPDNPIALTHKVTFIYGDDTEVQTVATGGFPEYVFIATTGDVRFLGWFEGETLIEDPFSVAVTRDIVYEAKYEVIEFVEVKLVVNGEETTQNIELGQTIEEPEAPTKEGYTFLGWSADNGETFIDFEMFTFSADTTITAIFEINEYTLTLNVDGTTTTQTVEHGQTLTLDNPSKEGYTFKNWLIDGQAVDLTNYVVTGDVTLTAEFEINTYTVTLNIDGTTTTQTVEYGQTLTLEEPQKQGYTFINWTLNGEVIDLSTYTVTEDITLVAVFEKSVTSASLFTFEGDTLTGYNGEEKNIIIPKTYSLGEIVKNTQEFTDKYDLRSYIDSSGKYEVQVVTADNETKMVSRDTVNSVVYPVTVEVETQTYIDGDDIAITKIGNSAFSSSSIESVVLQNNIIEIKSSAFSSCKQLTSVTLSPSLTRIYSSTFAYCSILESIVIPDSVTRIDSSAFDKCNALTSVSIGSQVNEIYLSSFPVNALKEIDNAYYLADRDGNNTYCIKAIDKTMTSLTISESCRVIASQAFYNSTNLTTLTIPNNVEVICDTAFSGCTGLKELVLKEGLRVLNRQAFKGCTGLTNVVIPDSVEIMGENVFLNCTGLKELTLGEEIKALASSTLYNLPLENLIIKSKTFPSITGDFIPNTTCTVYVVDELLETYKTNEYLSTHADQFVALSEREEV